MNNFYNENSKPQGNVITKNQDLINQSIYLLLKNIKDLSIDQSIKILDVGSAQGRNSNSLLNSLISKILKEIGHNDGGSELAIEVYHNDLEINNWTQLFNEFNKQESSYKKLSNSGQIFSYGVGNSFYEQVVPSNSIDYTFMLNCAHWCRVIENLKPKDSCIEMERQPLNSLQTQDKLNDLHLNLLQRSKELKKGGILICNLISYENPSCLHMGVTMKLVFKEMIEEGIDKEMTMDELNAIKIPFVFFDQHEIQKVLSRIPNLKLISMDHNQTDCILEPLIQSHGIDTFSKQMANFLISAFEGILKEAIKGTQSRKDQILNEFVQRYINHVKKDQSKFRSNISSHFIVLEKQ